MYRNLVSHACMHELFGLLVTNFYKGLNRILKTVTGDELGRLETAVLKFLVEWSNLRHATLELYQFTAEYIAKQLKTLEYEVAEAIDKLKRLGLLDRLDSFADSVLNDRVYELCEQFAKSKNKKMIFFYR